MKVRTIVTGKDLPGDLKIKTFATSMKSGQATDPGLSMSYDIVTKGHGGTLNV